MRICKAVHLNDRNLLLVSDYSVSDWCYPAAIASSWRASAASTQCRQSPHLVLFYFLRSRSLYYRHRLLESLVTATWLSGLSIRDWWLHRRSIFEHDDWAIFGRGIRLVRMRPCHNFICRSMIRFEVFLRECSCAILYLVCPCSIASALWIPEIHARRSFALILA